MSKQRALELALQLRSSSSTDDEVISTAQKFAAFLAGEQGDSDVAEVKAALKSSARKVKDTAAKLPPVVSVDAANESSASAEAAVEPKADATPPPKAEPVKAEAEAPASTTVTMEQVKVLVGKLATNALAGGAPKAREILGLYGATNISTLKPEKYGLVKASLEAILKAAEDAAAVAA